jgi:hypothetical protein
MSPAVALAGGIAVKENEANSANVSNKTRPKDLAGRLLNSKHATRVWLAGHYLMLTSSTQLILRTRCLVIHSENQRYHVETAENCHFHV